MIFARVYILDFYKGKKPRCFSAAFLVELVNFFYVIISFEN